MSITRSSTVRLASLALGLTFAAAAVSPSPRTSSCRRTRCSGDRPRPSCRPGRRSAVLEGNPVGKGAGDAAPEVPGELQHPAALAQHDRARHGAVRGVPRRHGRQAGPSRQPDARAGRVRVAAGEHAPLRVDRPRRPSCRSISKGRSTSSTSTRPTTRRSRRPAVSVGGACPWQRLQIEQLRSSVRGAIVQPGDDAYESARKVYNADDRQAPRAHRALRRRGGRDRRRQLRPHQQHADRDSRRRPQRRRPGHV